MLVKNKDSVVLREHGLQQYPISQKLPVVRVRSDVKSWMMKLAYNKFAPLLNCVISLYIINFLILIKRCKAPVSLLTTRIYIHQEVHYN